MLMLAGMPAVAQQQNSDKEKQEARAKNFADFLLYWSEWRAVADVSRYEKKRAAREDYENANERIPKLVHDSIYYADEITKRASIINKRYPLDEKPDMIFFSYEIREAYKYKNVDKNSDEYIMGKILAEYEHVLKKLKLDRYTIKLNQK